MASYVGSIADLMLNSGRLQAQRLIQAANIAAAGQQRIADIAANAELARAQGNTALVNTLAQTVSGSLGDYLNYKAYNNRTRQQDQQLADQHEESLLRRRALATAENNDYQSRRAMMPQAVGGGPDDAAYDPTLPAPYVPPTRPLAPIDPERRDAGGGPEAPYPGITSGAMPEGPVAPVPADRLNPSREVMPTEEQMLAGQPTMAHRKQLQEVFDKYRERTAAIEKTAKEKKAAQADALGIVAFGLENNGTHPTTGEITPGAWRAGIDRAKELGVPQDQLDALDLQYQSDPKSVLPLLDGLIDNSPTGRDLRDKAQSANKPVPVTPGTPLWDPKTRTFITNPVAKEGNAQLQTVSLNGKNIKALFDSQERTLMYQGRNIINDPGLADALPNRDPLAQELAEQRLADLRSKKAGGSDDPLLQSGLTGEEFLATLDPVTAREVKAYAEGRNTIPARATTDPKYQRLLQYVQAYDPDFDTGNFNARVKARQDFTTGKSAQTINAINTAIGHVADLQEHAMAFFDLGTPAANAAKNWLSRQFGSGAVQGFETVRNGVADELTRVWRQSGGTESDIAAWKDSLDSASTTDGFKQAFKAIGGMLESKLDSSTNQRDVALGRFGADIPIITPRARRALDRLQGIKAAGAGPKKGDSRPITLNGTTYPGTEETFNGTAWVRTK